jgi:hypothetical protein
MSVTLLLPQVILKMKCAGFRKSEEVETYINGHVKDVKLYKIFKTHY